MNKGVKACSEKRHGLWAFHHAIYHSGLKYRWWDGELERAKNAVSYIEMQDFSKPYAPKEVIKKCATRAMTMLKLPMTVGTYIDLCNTIGSRMSAHPRSITAAIDGLAEYKRSAPVVVNSEYGCIRPKRRGMARHDVRARYERLKLYKNTHCCMCNKEIYKPKTKNYFFALWHIGVRVPETDENAMKQSWFRLCEYHHKQMARLETKTQKAEEARLQIGRAKRIINKHRKEAQNESA